ncbi:MAG: GtrA family protein [Ruminiclostridium sp.]|nr:GtrA family protein [Ruminiclostridium sp.]
MTERAQKLIKLFFEFFRYAIVGGISFLADAGTLYIFREWIFRAQTDAELLLCTALGFLVGLGVNYILSIFFVFRKNENRNNGRDLRSILIFALIGVIGLGLTELGMYVGTVLLHGYYLFVRILVAGLVLIWNYTGRKIFVFEKK